MIVVVGDVMTDVIVRPVGAAAPGTDQAARIVRRAGGSGANIACWLGDAGVATRFAGRVGAADAAMQTAALRLHGVEARLAADPERETGAVVALLGEAGARGFFTDRAANLGLCEADLPDSLLDGARALHVSGHVFFASGPRAAARRLIEAAARRGVEVSVDAGSAGWLMQAGAARFREWTRDAALCFANADEAALLAGHGRLFVVTLGSEGAEARQGGVTIRVPAPAVEVRDGTGAGDAFAAGFLAARGRGAALAACLDAATGLAARCLTLAGGRPAGGYPWGGTPSRILD